MDLGTLLAVLLPLSVLIYWFVDTLKDLTNRNWNGLLTRVISVVSAIAAVSLYAHSSIDLGSGSHDIIAAWSGADIVLASLLFAATGGTINDTLRTFNRADTTVKSHLLPPRS